MSETLPATVDAPAAAPPAEQRGTVAELVAWADSARAAFTIAESLARTSFVPEAFRGKAHEITAAILTGNEMGLSPMAAVRAFDLIKGTPAMRANAMRALIQSHGHAIWEEETTATRAVVCGRRAGEAEVHRSEWTIERAREAQLTGKDNWKRQPTAMLLARATSEACRLTASDVLHGVPYSAEELTDGTASATRTVRRRNKSAVEEPSNPEPEVADALIGDEAEAATEADVLLWTVNHEDGTGDA
ncbi:hypothetical protein SSP35_03_03310 [Streptomyces sp. NBRC 110611]|uniref:hypothetical protein n=1 Tax=Streptomyces sp. NBRC 110611 TaxID=1621259 RepID=UPI0008354420|nr:hypothetical protein [Streptomyces sp. NBRC 110611]GAU66683.1 hypothetical protein SSP35_03_03310 [Streptomyces sp. NBRC 110611]